MDPIITTIIRNQDDAAFKQHLDSCGLDQKELNKFFHKAARLPGNWTRYTNRNEWLQPFYEEYVSEKVRKDVSLTNKRKFQQVRYEVS